MCITPQRAKWTVLFKTNPLLSAVLLIICFSPLGSAGCPPGQFLHFNPETNIGMCCFTVTLPIGYGFKSCELNGTLDTIEKCPMGLHQPDNTTTESEAICSSEFECNQEDNVKVVNCDTSGQNCVSSCICNYEGGYCGRYFYHCKKFPKGCPSELVERDCTCKRDPLPVRSSPGNSSYKPGQTIITTSSTVSTYGGYKPTQENDATKGDGGVDINNGTANTNRTGSIPVQIQSTVLNVALITIGIVLGVGVIAVVTLVYIFHKRLKKWLSEHRNICCWNKSTNPDQDFPSLDSVLTLGSGVSGQVESSEHSEQEAQPFLSGGGSEDCFGDCKNPAGGQSEGGSNIQSLVVDNDESEGCNGAPNNPADGENNDGDIQAGGASMQSLVVYTAGSKGCYGDEKNSAGDQGEGDSIHAGGSSIQSLVVDHGKSGSQGIETAGPFCSCCGRHWKRCNKRVIEKSLARVKPQQGVNGMRQTPQFLEIPSTENVESERSVDGYSSFSSSIYHDPESHAADEETSLLKPVSSQEATYSEDQISSIVQQISEVEGTRFEELQQADNEDHMTTGMPIVDHYRTDSHSGVINHDEQELTVENEEDVEILKY